MSVSSRQQDLVDEGVAAAKAGNRAAARALLLQAVQRHPENARGWLWLASVAEAGPEKVVCLQRFLALEPGHPQGLATLKKALLELGIQLARKGEKMRARPVLTELSTLDPDNPQVWLWLASVMPTDAEAVPALQRVLELDPDHEQAHTVLRRVALKLVPRSAWNCPLCGDPAPQPMRRCPCCRAILDLDDIGAVLANAEVEERLLQEFVVRCKNREELDLGFEVQGYLALAYLNLKKPAAALQHMELACRLRPADRELEARRDALRGALRPPSGSPGEPPPRGTVLAIDDSITVQKLVSATLESQGYRVILASNGMQALSRLNECKPDFILLDINMPQMDGYQVCRLIKGAEATKHIPVVMLSGKDGFFDKMRGRMAGAAEYITKPFESGALIQMAQKYCRPRDRT